MHNAGEPPGLYAKAEAAQIPRRIKKFGSFCGRFKKFIELSRADSFNVSEKINGYKTTESCSTNFFFGEEFIN